MTLLSLQLSAAESGVVAEGLNHPWALAFLPDGDFLVTEKVGALRRVRADGRVSEPLAGVPAVYFAGQGGLMEVRLHPEFAQNRFVYLSFAHGTPKANATRVIRGTLTATGLIDVIEIFTVEPLKDTPVHYGGRLAFLPDGTLLITTGDGFNYREAAQDLTSLLGKTVRVTDTGEVPDDNPRFEQADAHPKIFSYGHRNPQGLVVDARSGAIYLHEHGPKGGDEINKLVAGGNYGWPAATYGLDYTGAHVSPFKTLPGVLQPLKIWVPSIAPSGLDLYRGDLLVGALVDAEVRRVNVEDGSEAVVFADLDERVREVRTGPDGCIYVLTDGENGRLVRGCED
ncbi:MAG: PQQ-dependent sugar dehydrogenase [Pseudomonadales bacterium]